MQAASDAYPTGMAPPYIMKQYNNMYSVGMVSIVGFDEKDVADSCKVASFESSESLRIAIEVILHLKEFISFVYIPQLAPNNYTVAGGKNACNQFKRIMKKLGARYCKQLAVSGAFHTEYMKSAAAALSTTLERITIHPGHFPVVSNVSNEIYTVDNARQLLFNQLVSPLKWWSAIDAVIESCRVENIVEIGPGNICSSLVKDVNEDGGYQIKYYNISFK